MVVLGLVQVLVTSSLAAHEFPLPVEVLLEGRVLEVELINADVELVIAEDVVPKLHATVPHGSPAQLGIFRTDQGHGIRRTSQVHAVRIEVRIWVRPTFRVLLHGTDVALRAEDRSAAVGAEPPGGDTTPPSGFDLTLDHSQADLAGLRLVALRASSSALWLRRTRTLLDLTLDGGTAEIQGHRGELTLRASEAEVKLREVEGRVALELEGGSLEAAYGTGQMDGTARDAVVALDEWTGELALHGVGGRFEARSVAALQEPWKIDGEDLQVSLEQIAGPLVADLKGGVFVANAPTGKVTLTASQGADLNLAGASGPVVLRLSGGARGHLVGVEGLHAQAEDAEVQVDGVRSLSLTANRCQVTARGVEQVAHLATADSDLELDLSALRTSPRVTFAGSGHAEVTLRAPCIVELQTADAWGAGQVRPTGCELRLEGQAPRRVSNPLLYGSSRATILTVILGEGMTLAVAGRTVE